MNKGMPFRKLSLVPFMTVVMISIVLMSAYMVMPCLPEIARVFAAEEKTVQFIISLNFLGWGLSGLIYGPLSDAYGRRSILIGGTSLFVVATFMCATAESLPFLIAARFLQGLGSGVPGVVGLASIKDIYEGKKSVRIVALMGVLIGLTPVVSPIIGGYVLITQGWKSVFLVTGMVGLFLLVLIYFLMPETLIAERRLKLKLPMLYQVYKKLLTRSSYILSLLNACLGFTTIGAYTAIMPFVLIQPDRFSAESFGYVQGIVALGFALGSWYASWHAKNYKVTTMIFLGFSVDLLAGLGIVGAAYVWPSFLTLQILLIGISNLGCGLMFAGLTTRALELVPETTGTSAALMRSMQMGFASLTTFTVVHFYSDNLNSAALYVVGASFIGLISEACLERFFVRA